MKRLLQKLIATGADFSTRATLKSALNFIGIEPSNIDRLYMELKNDMYRNRFSRTPPSKRIIFLPQCLRKKGCEAGIGEWGYKCTVCNPKCKVGRIKSMAESLGYRVIIAPGGSMVMKALERFGPLAVAGVACIKEIVLAMENIRIPVQGIELLRDGCVDTDVNLEDVFSVLRMGIPHG